MFAIRMTSIRSAKDGTPPYGGELRVGHRLVSQVLEILCQPAVENCKYSGGVREGVPCQAAGLGGRGSER